MRCCSYGFHIPRCSGAIVAELPTGAQAGLGSRLLSGSYYGQTSLIWAALITASALSATLVACRHPLVGIRVMASGGDGVFVMSTSPGVRHPGFAQSPYRLEDFHVKGNVEAENRLR